MSSADNNFDNVFATQPPPAHHQHRSSDVLPGVRGANQGAVNYSADVTNDSRVWEGKNERHFGAGTDTGAVMAGGQHAGGQTGLPSTIETDEEHHEEHHEERPMNVQPTGAGKHACVAITC
jgi:hypothetical protein